MKKENTREGKTQGWCFLSNILFALIGQGLQFLLSLLRQSPTDPLFIILISHFEFLITMADNGIHCGIHFFCLRVSMQNFEAIYRMSGQGHLFI